MLPEDKRKGAARFKHWHYEADLGDGIVMPATIPNEPDVMREVENNRNILFGLLQRHFGGLENKRILDVGCSAGYHSLELARQGAIVTGIDHDEGAIQQARFIQKCQDYSNKARFYSGNFFKARFKPESFDVVYCSGVLYHLSDPLGAIQLMHSWCSRGAVILSSVLPGNELRVELGDPARFSFSLPNAFELVPTAPLLRRMFEHAGFEVLEMADRTDYATNGIPPMRDDWANVVGPAFFVVRKIPVPKISTRQTLRGYARTVKRYLTRAEKPI